MTKVPIDENSTKWLLDGQCKDLQQIDGIGQKWEDKLNEFGIFTIQDLATVSDKKAGAITEATQGISLEMLRGWRKEANERRSSERVVERTDAVPNTEVNSPVT